MKALTPYTLVALAAALGGARVTGHTSELFQALAHCYVGGLFGAGFCGRKLALTLAVALTALETACFLLGVGK